MGEYGGGGDGGLRHSFFFLQKMFKANMTIVLVNGENEKFL